MDRIPPHDPFDASNETSYGHPRGQLHYWISDWGFYIPVCRTDVPCIIDANLMEIDQDYDWNHPSSTECTYDNPTGRTVTFGESSTDEMCFTSFMYYPAQGAPFVCSDLW